jgi:hypothetical protein
MQPKDKIALYMSLMEIPDYGGEKTDFSFLWLSCKTSCHFKGHIEVGLWQSQLDKWGAQRLCKSTFGRSSQPDFTVHADKLYRAGKANQLLSIFEQRRPSTAKFVRKKFMCVSCF